MGGVPAWTRVPDGQWYLHLFTAEQPDLNWANREVRDDFLATLRFWSDRGVDGFRVDVAHGLAKNLVEPLAAKARLADTSLPPGAHPFWDRDEVHDIYAEWRQVFNEYEPPRTAVAEAWVDRSRRHRYASPQGLGQAFNFDLLDANWDAGQFRGTITDSLAGAQQQVASTTWVLSNHDVVRHPTRYGLPPEKQGSHQNAQAWLLSDGAAPALDRELGLRRARAALLLMLALPGSAYLYQGEELGLREVGDLPGERLQDPVFWRSRGTDKGRDGCRVPLPWTAGGPSFGFGTGPAHLPQPAWFGFASVEAQEHDPASTLNLYRHALGWRRKLQAAENFEWIPGSAAPVIHHLRPVMTRSSPSRSILVAMFVASDDATSGSVIAKHERISPSSNGSSHRRFCSPVPNMCSSSMLPVSGAEQLHASAARTGERPMSSASGESDYQIRLPHEDHDRDRGITAFLGSSRCRRTR